MTKRFLALDWSESRSCAMRTSLQRLLFRITSRTRLEETPMIPKSLKEVWIIRLQAQGRRVVDLLDTPMNAWSIIPELND